jgi:hypothetical protein
MEGLFKKFRKNIEDFFNFCKSKLKYLRYKSNILRLKSLYWYHNRVKLHFKYDSRIKDGRIIQKIQKILRIYLHYFL